MQSNRELTFGEKLILGVVILIAVILFGGALLPHPTAQPVAQSAFGTPTLTPTSFSIGEKALANEGIKCGAQTISGGTPVPCVESDYGRPLVGYTFPGTLTPAYNIGGDGNAWFSGNVNLGGSYVGITPVATATLIQSINSLAVTTPGALSVAGTPVIPFATPQSTPTPDCFFKGNITVTGSATLAPGQFPTPVSYASFTLNSPLTTDNGGGVSVITTTNSVTVNVYQRFLSGTATPQAAATQVTGSVCTR